ncbi:uracil phosphoribosyltransferase [Paraliobacillus quinghaiensis]|uniref:Uracil phosphoribosyltransferase n=1 Tax=Paraliobacillus quinghaiensis TaxID=470815 RepID=A0A917TMV8_9BACI|nr:CopY/TcrY family copper transport repressor [Paraliobacillus quinghaiensis]GGM29575.1 uracil phosphoribosyltransferase [Paraliobacillus quinghaiensis]
MEDKSQITDAEWEVMRVVWTLHQATSKDIIEVLRSKKNWKQATAKTLIGRLVQKGLLETEQDGKRYLYTAAVDETESVKMLEQRLFDRICNKEVGKTIASMISESTLSHNDIELLEETLNRKKSEAVEEVKCNCVPGQCQCKGHHH